MKCSNLLCNRGVGLVHHRRWFSKQLYCSRQCRDAFVAQPPKNLKQQQTAATYFEWLFLQPIETNRLKPMPAIVRRSTR